MNRKKHDAFIIAVGARFGKSILSAETLVEFWEYGFDKPLPKEKFFGESKGETHEKLRREIIKKTAK